MNIQRFPPIAVVPGADGLNRRAFTAEDVRRMTEVGILAEDDPFELVDGELIEMASKGFAHERMKTALLGEIFAVIDRRAIFVGVECTLRLDGRTLIEPDIMVCRRSAVRESGEGYAEVVGSDILLLIEVADSSLRYDEIRKAVRYAAYGIPEYWIADLNASQMLVHHRPAPGGYGDIRAVPAADTLRPLAPNLARLLIRLADLA